jgi:hypothetical protein
VERSGNGEGPPFLQGNSKPLGTVHPFAGKPFACGYHPAGRILELCQERAAMKGMETSCHSHELGNGLFLDQVVFCLLE